MRRGYELNTLFLGRRVRPFHLAVTIATAVVAWTLHTPGSWAPDDPAQILTYAAAVSATALTVGWWFRSDRAAAFGLLLATGVWASRAVYAALTTGTGVFAGNPWASVALSVAWTIGAGGAYLLERAEARAVSDDV
jgi:hypothetical protein